MPATANSPPHCVEFLVCTCVLHINLSMQCCRVYSGCAMSIICVNDFCDCLGEGGVPVFFLTVILLCPPLVYLVVLAWAFVHAFSSRIKVVCPAHYIDPVSTTVDGGGGGGGGVCGLATALVKKTNKLGY